MDELIINNEEDFDKLYKIIYKSYMQGIQTGMVGTEAINEVEFKKISEEAIKDSLNFEKR